jgi:hypothetical protein
MIINKSCAFQLPSAEQMQKNIFAFKKSASLDPHVCFFILKGEASALLSSEIVPRLG